MEHNTNRILWTVLSLAIGVSLYVGFHPAINSQAKAVVQTIAGKLNDSNGTADSEDDSDFTYSEPNKTDNTISVTGYKGNKTDVTIPTYHKIGSVDYKVTAIGDKTFYENENIKQVTIPDSVTSIGDDAFDYNTALTSVDIPDSVTSIGDDAFCDDSSLESLTLGSGVTSIGEEAFCHTALTSVDFPTNLKSIGEEAFEGTALTSVDFPASVTSIGDYAFNNTPISAISLKSPINLGYCTFSGTKLTNVILPEGSTYVTNTYPTFDSNVKVTIK